MRAKVKHTSKMSIKQVRSNGQSYLSSVVVRTEPIRYNSYISVAASRNGTGSHLSVTKVAALITPRGLHQAESDHVSVEIVNRVY